MIVFCEQCGKKYEIDPSKIHGQNVEANCTSCNGKIRVQKSDSNLFDLETSSEAVAEPSNTTVKFEQKRKAKQKSVVSSESKKRALGLRTKILLLFFLVPIVLIVTAGYLFLGQLNNLSSIISKENTKVVTDIAESIISQKAYSVARQVKLYLTAHPDLVKENFMNDAGFKAVAIQKVGKTGYTVIDEQGTDGKWRTWAHIRPSVCAPHIDDMAVLKGAMGENFEGFWRVLTGVKPGSPSKGYYKWQESDGSFKDKYMVSVNIEGTPFNVSATTYIDEFTQPMKNLEAKALDITKSTEQYVIAIIATAAFLVALIAISYGSKLSGKIRKLKNIADSISVGDMDIEFNIKDKDELGDLAQAISRMQDSIRLSIERLRRRQSQPAA